MPSSHEKFCFFLDLIIALFYGCVTVENLITNLIDRLQERALRIAYSDKYSTFYQLLEKDNSVAIHTRNLQYLATKLKSKYSLFYDRDFRININFGNQNLDASP